MPRHYIPVAAGVPYHVAARTVNREPFPLPLDRVWSLMENHLFLMSKGFDVDIHSFVLMPNHFHLIATARKPNFSSALLYFMRETSKEFNRQSGRMNQVYGSRNYKTMLTNYHYFLNTYKYVYQNPLRARLCRRVQDYPYSTLRGLCGGKPLLIPIAEDTVLFTPRFSDETLRWLNSRPPQEHEIEMRLALRKARFRLVSRNQQPSELESRLI